MSKRRSPCCDEAIWSSRGDGVTIGCCSKCHTDILRINPRTGVEEWLDGESPWNPNNLRAVE